jgi:flagellar hook-associated protein 3 FlgL
MLNQRVLRDLRAQTLRLLDLQGQLATGYRVNRPSDDALAARRAIAARTEIGGNAQYIANISNVSPFIRESEAALTSTVDALQRANELALQGLNATNGQVQRDQIANEINQLLESLLEQANTVNAGRYVFGGSFTLQRPFQETRNPAGDVISVAYAGNSERIRVESGRDSTVPINVTGDETYAGGVNILQTLIDMRDSLRTGDLTALETSLQGVQDGQSQILLALSKVGSTEARMESIRANLELVNIQLETVISENIDADFAEVILQFNAQSNAYQAALNAAGRALQPSLLDFIR